MIYEALDFLISIMLIELLILLAMYTNNIEEMVMEQD